MKFNHLTRSKESNLLQVQLLFSMKVKQNANPLFASTKMVRGLSSFHIVRLLTILISLARDGRCGDQLADHIQPGGGQEQPPPQLPKPELHRRISIMFSSKTGIVVRSGDVAATSAPTYQIISDIFEDMEELEKRSPALFDKHAKHRPCGLLDKYGAAGMLVGDVVGLPLMPWELAEKVGKAAAKLPAQLAGEKKKAKLAAKRNGMPAPPPPHSTPPQPTLPSPPTSTIVSSHPTRPHPTQHLSSHLIPSHHITS